MPLAPLLKKLRAVTAVAALGSTAEAAERLHLSTSAVVRAVQQVEAQLGWPLFDRGPRGMSPGPAGRQLATRAGRALDRLAAAGPPMATGPFATLLGLQPIALGWTGSRLATHVGHRHLQALLALSTGGFEREAAATLHISQSALHQTLAQLEHLAGGALFDRTRQGLRLNPRGDTLLRATQWALDELRQAEEELAALHSGEVGGTVTVGTLPFSTALFLPAAVERTLALHPGLHITVVDGVYETLVQRLQQAEIDFVVGALRRDPPAELQQELLFLDQLTVVARPGHPLAGRTDLRLTDLAQHDWICPMSGTPAEAAFEQAFRARSQLRVNSALMMEALLATSDRLAMMSSRQTGLQDTAQRLIALPLPLRHAPRRVGVLMRRDYLPTAAAGSLLAAMQQASAALKKHPAT